MKEPPPGAHVDECPKCLGIGCAHCLNRDWFEKPPERIPAPKRMTK